MADKIPFGDDIKPHTVGYSRTITQEEWERIFGKEIETASHNEPPKHSRVRNAEYR
jgi:hypothetical protein